jgi:hypothetical protein
MEKTEELVTKGERATIVKHQDNLKARLSMRDYVTCIANVNCIGNIYKFIKMHHICFEKKKV